MSFTEEIRCDQCQRLKLETNHWFMLNLADGVFQLFTWNMDNWREYEHICSEECAVKTLNKWMEGRRK